MRTLATLALCLLPSISLAQTAKEKQKAGELVKQAIAKSQAGDHEAAVELYNDAYKIIPQPLLLSNIGSEYQQMEHKEVEALGYFCKYLAADPNGQNAGYATAQAKTLYIKLGGVTDVKDDDVCKPIVKPAPVITPPTNTQPTTTTTTETTEPAGGSQVDTGTGTKTSPMRYVGAGIAVVGAGMFAFGIYEGLQAKKISDEITNHPMNQPWESNIKDREAEGQADEKKQVGFMIGGGVAIAAGAAMFFLFAPHASGEHAVAVAPVVTGDQLGFAAAGRF